MQWYYTHNSKQEGPVDWDDLVALAAGGNLDPADFVWNESMGENWQPASSVEGLLPKPAAVSIQPPELPEDRHSAPSTAVSCTVPVGEAWHWMVDMLFRPFEIGKWFVLGLVSMFAFSGGAARFNFTSSGSWNQKSDMTQPSDWFDSGFDETVEFVRSFVQEHQDLLAIGVTLGVLLVLVFWLVGTWLQSRMKFVFVDNVVRNTAAVKYPWRLFSQHGNSLFRWSICYDLVRGLIALLLLGITAWLVVFPLLHGRAIASAIGGMFLVGLLWIVFFVFSAYINRFREDMIIPMMYKLDLTATEAWREFGQNIWTGHRGSLLLYGLFWTLLSLGAQVCVGLFGLLTCGIGCCCMMIPYIGAVVTLPVPVFLRTYSLAYLGQFGSRYELDDESE